MELYTVSDSPGSHFLETVARACQLTPQKLKIVTKHEYTSPRLVADDPALQNELKSRISVPLNKQPMLTLNHPRAIARYLTRSSGNSFLLGEGPLEIALTDELMSMSMCPITPKILDVIDKIASKNKPYLASPKGIRLGDLAIYTAIKISNESLSTRNENLKKWFNLVTENLNNMKRGKNTTHEIKTATNKSETLRTKGVKLVRVAPARYQEATPAPEILFKTAVAFFNQLGDAQKASLKAEYFELCRLPEAQHLTGDEKFFALTLPEKDRRLLFGHKLWWSFLNRYVGCRNVEDVRCISKDELLIIEKNASKTERQNFNSSFLGKLFTYFQVYCYV
mmetsp:Transcript_10955/g.26878  ORF Transcript_10955/g.26878 Transcript_10955/m.26878 type:complete len:337 (-) Transcript_10955:108-1118(-)